MLLLVYLLAFLKLLLFVFVLYLVCMFLPCVFSLFILTYNYIVSTLNLYLYIHYGYWTLNNIIIILLITVVLGSTPTSFLNCS